jgi:Fe-S-cluster-containing hydrogenase component 2
MARLTLKSNLILQFQQVLHALLAVIRPDLPLDLQHTRITADETLPVLGYASAHRLSMEAACGECCSKPCQSAVLQRALKTRNRAGQTFRLAANSVKKADCPFGMMYRRLRSRLRPVQATVATAHAIARVF